MTIPTFPHHILDHQHHFVYIRVREDIIVLVRAVLVHRHIVEPVCKGQVSLPHQRRPVLYSWLSTKTLNSTSYTALTFSIDFRTSSYTASTSILGCVARIPTTPSSSDISPISTSEPSRICAVALNTRIRLLWHIVRLGALSST